MRSLPGCRLQYSSLTTVFKSIFQSSTEPATLSFWGFTVMRFTRGKPIGLWKYYISQSVFHEIEAVSKTVVWTSQKVDGYFASFAQNCGQSTSCQFQFTNETASHPTWIDYRDALMRSIQCFIQLRPVGMLPTIYSTSGKRIGHRSDNVSDEALRGISFEYCTSSGIALKERPNSLANLPHFNLITISPNAPDKGRHEVESDHAFKGFYA